MRAIRTIWTTPRIWRYAAVAAIMFTLGGTGTAVATSTGVTELIGNGVVAYVDSNHNLLVNDTQANSALGTANGHLANIDSKLGSGTVNVGGTVASTQSGTWTDNLDSTDAANLAGVNSKLGGTLSVRASDNPALSPLARACSFYNVGGYSTTQTCFHGSDAIPVGQTFVIHSVSASCNIDSGIRPVFFLLRTNYFDYYINMVDGGVYTGAGVMDTWTVSEVTTLFLPGGSDGILTLALNGNATSNAVGCTATISGGLVPNA